MKMNENNENEMNDNNDNERNNNEIINMIKNNE